MPQDETEESLEAVMNVPLLANAMHLADVDGPLGVCCPGGCIETVYVTNTRQGKELLAIIGPGQDSCTSMWQW